MEKIKKVRAKKWNPKQKLSQDIKEYLKVHPDMTTLNLAHMIKNLMIHTEEQLLEIADDPKAACYLRTFCGAMVNNLKADNWAETGNILMWACKLTEEHITDPLDDLSMDEIEAELLKLEHKL